MPIKHTVISGHAPGRIRDAFLDALEFEETDTPEFAALCGKLWNCTDALPGNACADLYIRYGATYAIAARAFRTGEWPE